MRRAACVMLSLAVVYETQAPQLFSLHFFAHLASEHQTCCHFRIWRAQAHNLKLYVPETLSSFGKVSLHNVWFSGNKQQFWRFTFFYSKCLRSELTLEHANRRKQCKRKQSHGTQDRARLTANAFQMTFTDKTNSR